MWSICSSTRSPGGTLGSGANLRSIIGSRSLWFWSAQENEKPAWKAWRGQSSLLVKVYTHTPPEIPPFSYADITFTPISILVRSSSEPHWVLLFTQTSSCLDTMIKIPGYLKITLKTRDSQEKAQDTRDYTLGLRRMLQLGYSPVYSHSSCSSRKAPSPDGSFSFLHGQGALRSLHFQLWETKRAALTRSTKAATEWRAAAENQCAPAGPRSSPRPPFYAPRPVRTRGTEWHTVLQNQPKKPTRSFRVKSRRHLWWVWEPTGFRTQWKRHGKREGFHSYVPE